MSGIKIMGTGRFLPEAVISNDDFTAIVETSDEWIRTRTGMQRRHFASAAEPAWYIGAQAARQALDAAGLSASDMDMLIAATVTSDYHTPSAACLIQREIGAENAFALDIGAACAGFTCALDMARRYLVTGDVKHVLVVGVDRISQIINYEDRSTCVLFADGAGACVIAAGDGRFGSFLHSDAMGAQYVYAKKPVKSNPLLAGGAPVREAFPSVAEGLYMEGREVYKFAVKAMPEAVEKACAKIGVAPADLNLIIPHQANLRIIETAAKNLRVPMDKVYVNIHDYGNTSSASVAICLDECAREGRISRGDLVCAVGFGAGLVYGACVFEY